MVWLRTATLALFFFLSARAPVAESTESRFTPSPFIRFVDLDGWQGRLQTSVITYEDEVGARVTLVAAMHWGEPAYFAELQGIFDGFDALLYEGWKPEESDDVGEAPVTPVFWLLDKIERTARILEDFVVHDLLSFRFDGQWESLDYSRAHCINADMTYSTYRRLIVEENESTREFFSILRLALKYSVAWVQRLRSTSDEEVGRLFEAVWTEGLRPLRYLVASEMAFAFNLWAERISSPDSWSVTLNARNDVVLEILLEQLRAGKREIGIHYGAAHMPDLERRLIELGFQKKGGRWATTWDSRRSPKPERTQAERP